MKMSDKKNRGKIVCSRIIKFDEVTQQIKTTDLKLVVENIMRTEQEKWKSENPMFIEKDGATVKNINFFKDCFEKWEYFLDDSPASKQDIEQAIKDKIVWDFELKVEYDSKLTAYKMLKGIKD
jgi:hypothetical protein